MLVHEPVAGCDLDGRCGSAGDEILKPPMRASDGLDEGKVGLGRLGGKG